MVYWFNALTSSLLYLQGVPIRIEVGPRDMKKAEMVAVRRDTKTKECIQVTSDVGKTLDQMLKSMQSQMFQRQLYLILVNNVVQYISYSERRFFFYLRKKVIGIKEISQSWKIGQLKMNMKFRINWFGL